MVRDAKDSITVFTPFFGALLPKLLNNNANLIHAGSVTVVTNFNVDFLLEQGHQARALKQLLKAGVKVVSLPDLHAKVLIVDEAFVSVGSQNFTYRGTKNRETTIVPSESLLGSPFIQRLLVWKKEAKVIELEDVEDVISKLGKSIRQTRIDQRQLRRKFEALRNALSEERRRVQALHELETRSKFRFSERIFATIKPMKSPRRFSLRVDSNSDLTRWFVVMPGGRKRDHSIGHLTMHPVLLADNMRMGFARVGRTRITYVRYAMQQTREKGGLRITVRVEFPRKNAHLRNVVVKLIRGKRERCIIELLVGADGTLKVIRVQKGKRQSAEFDAVIDQVSSIDGLFKFLNETTNEFRFKTLDLADKNVRRFFTGQRYRISIITYDDWPVLLASRLQ